MVQYAGKALAILWPALIVSMLWIVGGLVALHYARATRRPIFLFGGIVAFLLVIEQAVSPLRVVLHYLQNKYIYTGTAGALDLVAGGYKIEWLIDALAAALLLMGVILEVRRARQRAMRAPAPQAAAPAGMAASTAAGTAPTGRYTQPSTAPSWASSSFGAPGAGNTAGGHPSQTFPSEE